MPHVVIGLRVAFLLSACMLVVNFYRLALTALYSVLNGRRALMTVRKFGFAVWCTAIGAILADAGHILAFLGVPQFSATDVTTAMGLALMTLGYYMHSSSKIEATGGNVQRFMIFGGGGIILAGVLCAVLPLMI